MTGHSSPSAATASWMHGRFEVKSSPDHVLLRDWLMPSGREVPVGQFRGLSGVALHRAWFAAGLAPGALGSAGQDVSDRPRDPDDPLFWQYPCRTEGAAWDLHAKREAALADGDLLHLYLGLPWATWIDKARKKAWGATGESRVEAQWRWVRTRLRGLRAVARSLGWRLRVHTVCQHIYWQDLLPRWKDVGVTDLWLSHCPADVDRLEGLTLHPWRLFAVNVEDATRNKGLQLGRDPVDRPLLASFVGAHADHYLSDIRLRLRALANSPDVVVEVSGQWHFEQVVYGEQVEGRIGDPVPVDSSVERYNRLLSDSVFALCPAGAGPNTLRLWEALAAGAIPVLMGHWPRLPEGGSLEPIDWDRVLLRVRDTELPTLLDRLRSMPLSQRREMQRLGRSAFEAARFQCCF